MPNRISKSTLVAAGIDPAKFPALVGDFLNEKASHVAHMKMVEADAKMPVPIAPNFRKFGDDHERFSKALQDHAQLMMNRHQAYPAPHAHPLIAAAISGDGQFEIYNDDAEVAAIQLNSAKSDLVHRILRDETMAIEKISPANQHRALQYREHDIVKKGESNWTEEDRRFIEDQEAARDHIDEVQRRTANLLAEIDNLTTDTILEWTKKLIGATA